MAGLTPTIHVLDQETATAIVASTYVGVTFTQRGQPPSERAWQDFNMGMRRNLEAAGYRQPEAPAAAEVMPERWVAVAPGIIVRPQEYLDRFGDLDLDTLRSRMTPAVFKAYVRHVGVLGGPFGVDVNELVEEQPE